MPEPARSRQTAIAAPMPHVRFHLDSALSSLARLLRRPASTLLTISVMALAMSLPLGLWLSLGNVERLSQSVEQSRAIDLFLFPEIESERAGALAQQLRGWDGVAAVEHQTPEQGLAELREQAGLGEIAELLAEDNPLPHLLRVIPMGDETPLVSALKALPDVDLVQHDAQWRQRLGDWLSFGNRLVWVLGVLFGLGTALVVGNTVRLDIQARSWEMNVLQLLGASNAFIQRPFLYLGAWYGLGAGALAIGLVVSAGAGLRPPLAALASSYNSHFVLQGFSVWETVIILLGSTALGWLGAGLVSGQVLRRLQT